MRTAGRIAPVLLAGAVSAWIVSTVSSTGDYAVDAWPAVHALAHGHVGSYLDAQAMMGPFATLVQAPFAALGNGQLAEYRFGAFPCVLAAGFVGLYLGAVARRRGASRISQYLLAGLCLLNPLTFEALRLGHPEEILTAALAVAAVATAAEGHQRRTAVLLGLALASKQWAIIAILPVLMALPGKRLRVALIAAAIALALTLPGIIASPGGFASVQGNAASTGRIATPWSAWYPLTAEKEEKVGPEGATPLVARIHEVPDGVGELSHPLIVLLAFAVPLAVALRNRRFRLTPSDAMALLALLALLRCVLDPVDNLYYQLPILLALIGWDAVSGKRLPLHGLGAAAAALVLYRWSGDLLDAGRLNAFYLTIVVLALGYFTAAILRVPTPARSLFGRVYGVSPTNSGELPADPRPMPNF